MLSYRPETPKVAPSQGDIDSHLILGSLDPYESAPAPKRDLDRFRGAKLQMLHGVQPALKQSSMK